MIFINEQFMIFVKEKNSYEQKNQHFLYNF